MPPRARRRRRNRQFLAALLASGFAGQVVNLDISRGMLRRTERRVGLAALERVESRQGDVWTLQDDERFDLVCTHCFLDLFTPRQLEGVAARLDAALDPGGLWLCSDFVDPAPTGNLRVVGQRALLRALYGFFGWTCGVEPRRLPPIQAALAGRGLVPLGVREAAGGLLWSGCFRKPAAGSYNHRA